MTWSRQIWIKCHLWTDVYATNLERTHWRHISCFKYFRKKETIKFKLGKKVSMQVAGIYKILLIYILTVREHWNRMMLSIFHNHYKRSIKYDKSKCVIESKDEYYVWRETQAHLPQSIFVAILHNISMIIIILFLGTTNIYQCINCANFRYNRPSYTVYNVQAYEENKSSFFNSLNTSYMIIIIMNRSITVNNNCHSI